MRVGENPPTDAVEDGRHVALGERGVADQDAVEDRPEAVDVARRPDPVEVARGLLGAHVPGCPDDGAGAGHRRVGRRPGRRVGLGRVVAGAGVAEDLGDPPVDDQGLAERAEHDVRGLEVAVDDPPAVGVGDRVAGVDDAPQQPVEEHAAAVAEVRRAAGGVEPGDRVLEGLAADQVHRVIGAAVRVPAQAVDRDDPRVFGCPGDLRSVRTCLGSPGRPRAGPATP